MKFAVLFGLQALLLAWAAASWGGFCGAVCLWASASFAAVACAYGLRRPQWFGKGPGGRLSAWHKAFLAPFLAVLWGTWHAIRLTERQAAFHRTHPRLLVARRLLGKEVPQGVTHVIDLTCEFDEPQAVREGRRWLPVGCLDACAPPTEPLLAALQATLDDPTSVTLIHCAQGHGRTGTAAALWLGMAGLASTPQQALHMLQAARSGIKLSAAQHTFLEDTWERALSNRS